MRRFWLVRDEDETGVSGTGVVAVGVMFPNEKCALSWQTPHTSVAVYDDLKTVEAIHGHGGLTRVVWLDPVREPRRDMSAEEWGSVVRDVAGQPIAPGDLVMPVRLMGCERDPLIVREVRPGLAHDGGGMVSAVGWPECGYGLGADRADSVRVVRAAEPGDRS